MKGPAFLRRANVSLPFGRRLWVSLLLLLAAVFVILFLDLWSWAWLAILLLWTSFAALFPFGWAALLLGLGLLANWGLGQANAYKIALNSMPITTLDLRIVAGDSALLWYVLNWPQWTRWLFIAVLLCLLAYIAYQAVLRAGTSSFRQVAGVAIWGAALLCVLGLLDEKLFLDVKRHLAVISMQEDGPIEVARVASRVGVIPFLFYSVRLERESGSLLFDGGRDVEAVPYSDVLKAAGRFFSPQQGRRPNIVLVQLESILDSANAIQVILDRLRAIETETGRPFVLMFYGDHQPHSFTKMLRSEAADYDSVRSDAGRSQTFVHVMSSLPRGGKHIDGEIPVSLLPTILSSFVADAPDDLYMAANIHLFEICGSDLYRSTPSNQVFGVGTAPGIKLSVSGAVAGESSASASDACELAQKRTVVLLRGPSGIFKAGRLQPR